MNQLTQWKVKELTLEAHYFNAESDRLTVSCQSIVHFDGEYVDDRASDGRIVRSELKSSSLLAEGIDTQPLGGFTPTQLHFTDAITGESKTLQSDS